MNPVPLFEGWEPETDPKARNKESWADRVERELAEARAMAVEDFHAEIAAWKRDAEFRGWRFARIPGHGVADPLIEAVRPGDPRWPAASPLLLLVVGSIESDDRTRETALRVVHPSPGWRIVARRDRRATIRLLWFADAVGEILPVLAPLSRGHGDPAVAALETRKPKPESEIAS